MAMQKSLAAKKATQDETSAEAAIGLSITQPANH
jgi:hypothetical protein